MKKKEIKELVKEYYDMKQVHIISRKRIEVIRKILNKDLKNNKARKLDFSNILIYNRTKDYTVILRGKDKISYLNGIRTFK